MSKKGLSFRSNFPLNVPFFDDLLSRFAHDVSVEIGKSCRTEKGNGRRNKWRRGWEKSFVGVRQFGEGER